MSTRYPPAFLDELRARSDLVQVVSGYVSLKKNGKRYWGLCPFHGEKTASFSVDSEAQMYYCFGCKAGGNVIQFVMEMEKMTFPEAVTYLADQLHMPVPEMRDTHSGPYAFMSAPRRSVISPYASSHDIRSHFPLPRGPMRRMGCRRRSGWYICSMMLRPLTQARPRLRGPSGSGRTRTTLPSLTVRRCIQPP